MALIEQKLEKACQDLDIQGAVLVAGSADGTDLFYKVASIDSALTIRRQISLREGFRGSVSQESVPDEAGQYHVARILHEIDDHRCCYAMCGEGTS